MQMNCCYISSIGKVLLCQQVPSLRALKDPLDSCDGKQKGMNFKNLLVKFSIYLKILRKFKQKKKRRKNKSGKTSKIFLKDHIRDNN